MWPVGSEPSWSFFSTGVEASLAYVLGVGALLGVTKDTDLALDPLVPPVPPASVPEPIARKAEGAWSSWWEASMSEYRQACRDQTDDRSLETCEAMADRGLVLYLNRVRPLLTSWIAGLPLVEHFDQPISRLVIDAEAAHGQRAQAFAIRYDLLPVRVATASVVAEDPTTARSRLLISTVEARIPGRLERILVDAVDRVAF